MSKNTNSRPARRMRKGRQNNKRSNGGYGGGNTNSYTVINRPRFTFLDPHMFITLKYSETVPFSNATTVGSQNIFNLNSIFDPNRTGAGHQPYGFDQIAALYNRYRVLKTRWKVVFSPTSNLGMYACVVPVNGLLTSAISSATTFETAIEVPFEWHSIIPNAGLSLIHSGGIALNLLGGVRYAEFIADDRFEAAVSTSPAEIQTLYVGTYNPTGSTVATNVAVTLEYEVDFHDPISFAGS